MKKIQLLKVIVFLFGFLFVNVVLTMEAVAAPAPKWWRGSQAEYDQLLQDAEKEGKVFWYDSMADPEALIIIKAFNKLYPHIKVEHTRASTLEAREIILRELRAKSTQIDVLEVSNDLIMTFKELKLLKKSDWGKFRLDPIQLDKDSEMLKVGGSLHLMAYNTDLVSHKDVPKTWEDLLDPRWKGRKIALDTRPKGFIEMYVAWGEKKLVDYMQKLSKQQPIYKRGGTAMVEMLGAGEFPIAASITTKAIVRSMKKGAPVQMIVPSIIGTSFERLAVLAGAVHPRAATLFLGWLCSGGQEIYDEASNGEGMPLPGYDTLQGRLIKSRDQLAILTDEWLPKRAEIDTRLIEALGIKKK